MEQDRKFKIKFKDTWKCTVCKNDIIPIEGKLVITRKIPHAFNYTFKQDSQF